MPWIILWHFFVFFLVCWCVFSVVTIPVFHTLVSISLWTLFVILIFLHPNSKKLLLWWSASCIHLQQSSSYFFFDIKSSCSHHWVLVLLGLVLPILYFQIGFLSLAPKWHGISFHTTSLTTSGAFWNSLHLQFYFLILISSEDDVKMEFFFIYTTYDSTPVSFFSNMHLQFV